MGLTNVNQLRTKLKASHQKTHMIVTLTLTNRLLNSKRCWKTSAEEIEKTEFISMKVPIRRVPPEEIDVEKTSNLEVSTAQKYASYKGMLANAFPTIQEVETKGGTKSKIRYGPEQHDVDMEGEDEDEDEENDEDEDDDEDEYNEDEDESDPVDSASSDAESDGRLESEKEAAFTGNEEESEGGDSENVLEDEEEQVEEERKEVETKQDKEAEEEAEEEAERKQAEEIERAAAGGTTNAKKRSAKSNKSNQNNQPTKPDRPHRQPRRAYKQEFDYNEESNDEE